MPKLTIILENIGQAVKVSGKGIKKITRETAEKAKKAKPKKKRIASPKQLAALKKARAARK